jgi:DNA polymerase-3 subunit gamma/tau
LDEAGKISGLTRELAWQAGLVSVGAGSPAVWTLRVEHEALRTPALQDKLSEALGQALEVSVSLELVAGVPADTPARRQAAERARRQQAAEQLIRQDLAVVELLQQFKTARVVPGSIKPR